MPHGPTNFRSTVIKPYLEDQDYQNIFDQTDHQTAHQTAQTTVPFEAPKPPEPPETPAVPAKRGRGRPRIHPVVAMTADIAIFLQDAPRNKDQFKASWQKEIAGLLEKGVFKVVDSNSIPQGTRIFNSRFVDVIKNEGINQAFEKSRIVV